MANPLLFKIVTHKSKLSSIMYVAKLIPWRYAAGMDTRSVCEAAEIPISLLTVWQQRGLIPDYVAAGPGQRRDYTVAQAVHVGVMAALSRLGIGPTPGAAVARTAQQQAPLRRYMLVMPEEPLFLDHERAPVTDIPPGVRTITWREARTLSKGMVMSVPFDRLSQLDEFFAKYPYPRGPDAFIVLDVAAIRDRMEKLAEASTDAAA